MKVAGTRILCFLTATSSILTTAGAFRAVPQRDVDSVAVVAATVVGSPNNHKQIRGGGVVDGARNNNDKEDKVSVNTKAIGVSVAALGLSLLVKQLSQRLGSSYSATGAAKTAKQEIKVTLVPPSISVAPVAVGPTETDSSIVGKTCLSVFLTTLGLMTVLYCANLPDVTNFYNKLGLPKQLFGIAPVLYAAFAFITYSSSVVTELIAGGVSAAVVIRPTETPSDDWYASLQKPSWNPPGWVFPVMWLLICKPTQFLALRQMFLLGDTKVESTTTTPDWLALGVYCTQLALGNAWNDVFFGFQHVTMGLKVIMLMWATLLASAALFYQTKEWAGYLMLPTCAWVTIATALNYSINKLNPSSKK